MHHDTDTAHDRTPDHRAIKPLLLLAALGGAALLSAPLHGCNTVKGVGRDIESVGQAGQDAIDDSKND